ncbi:MAG: sugar phosphate isomerase/epimerase [Desulfobacteraceae bacterium]|nr:sugar phosphate isomerase/epimerase [Desulfobacteraceae bacterium]
MAKLFDQDKRAVVDRVQVNIPFTWLMDQQADYMEVFLENGINPEIGIDAEALDRFAQSDFQAAASKFRDAGCSITLHGPFLDLSPGSPDSEIRAVTENRLLQTGRAADAFLPQTIVYHAGYDETRYGFFREEWYEKAPETWRQTARRLADKKIRLMLENVYETDPDQLVRLFEVIDDSNIGCCLDIGHLSVFSKIPAHVWIKKLSPYLGQLHLHDNDGKSDQHLGLGRGSIDFTPLFDWLKTARPIPVITLEPHRKNDLIQSISYLSTILPFNSR